MKSRDFSLIFWLLGSSFLLLINALPFALHRRGEGVSDTIEDRNSNKGGDAAAPRYDERELPHRISSKALPDVPYDVATQPAQALGPPVTLNPNQLLYIFKGAARVITPRDPTQFARMMPLANVPSGATWVSYILEDPRPLAIYVAPQMWGELGRMGWVLRSASKTGSGSLVVLSKNITTAATVSGSNSTVFKTFEPSNSTMVLVNGRGPLAVMYESSGLQQAYVSMQFGSLADASPSTPLSRKIVILPSQLQRMLQNGWQFRVNSAVPPAYKLFKPAQPKSPTTTTTTGSSLDDYIQSIYDFVEDTRNAAKNMAQAQKAQSPQSIQATVGAEVGNKTATTATKPSAAQSSSRLPNIMIPNISNAVNDIAAAAALAVELAAFPTISIANSDVATMKSMIKGKASALLFDSNIGLSLGDDGVSSGPPGSKGSNHHGVGGVGDGEPDYLAGGAAGGGAQNQGDPYGNGGGGVDNAGLSGALGGNIDSFSYVP